MHIPTLPAHVTLIAVSKNQSDTKIDSALGLGLRHFGENRVQEAMQHWQSRRPLYPDLCLHLIGPLQSNKAEQAVQLFDVIHTVDRPKIAVSLHAAMDRQGKQIPCFIQVNIGDEPQKSGIAVADAADFLRFCRDNVGLKVIGLMAIPPVDTDPTPYFQRLQTMARDFNLPHLSMGMSDDYKLAIEYGASFVRLGTALFGER